MDLVALKDFLENNKYEAYQLLATLDDRSLNEYMRYPTLSNIDINAIYHLKFDKLPLGYNYYNAVTNYQQMSRTSWKTLYNIISAFLGGKHRLLAQYTFENDDISPFVIAPLIGERFNPAFEEQHRYIEEAVSNGHFFKYIFTYKKRNIIKYYLENNLIYLRVSY